MNQAPHLTRPNARLVRLEDTIAKQPAGHISRGLAKAELAALTGEPAAAALQEASIYTRCRTAAMDPLPSPPVRPARQRFVKELYGPNHSLPAAFRLGRLKTHWGTVIFADTETGTLRHGPEASSPRNVILAAGDGLAFLFHIGPDGYRYSIRIAAEGQFSGDQLTSGADRDGVQTFRALGDGTSQGAAIGLQDDRLLLCAESDGRITLSRRAFGPWERFELVKVRASQ
jgi:hypothetical protein